MFDYKRWRFWRWLVLSVVCLSVQGPAAVTFAKDPVSAIQDTAKAIVDIMSVNTTVVSGQPQGYFDRATGEVYISQRLIPLSYTRSGSGFIVDPSGIIVTNAHTVAGAGGLAVTLFNGQNVPVTEAHLVAGTDIAFLRFDPTFSLESIPIADSDKAVAGMSVYTIGHSDYLKGTVIGGRIMGVQWDVQGGVPHATAIQMSFDMAKGDSGCPVLDGKGRLLGMVAASLVGNGGTTIAIPSFAIKTALEEFRGSSPKN